MSIYRTTIRALARLLPQDCTVCGQGCGERLVCAACAARLPRLAAPLCPVCALQARQLAAQSARPDIALVAASCHSSEDLERAVKLGCDFAVFGAVRATASHPGVAGIGWEGLAAALAVPPLPTFALGGLSRADLDAAQRAGAHGIAAIRGAWS